MRDWDVRQRTAASKMRYQMNRLRRLAANFEMQREGSLRRHAEAIERALNPGGVLQERVHGAAYYFARYGFELAETLTALAVILPRTQSRMAEEASHRTPIIKG